MNRKQLTLAAILAVVALLFVIAFVRTGAAPAGDEHGHEESTEAGHEEEPERGPHNGKLFRDGDYAFEVTIYETGVEPQFRIYPFKNDKPLPATELSLTATVSRLGASDAIHFAAEADYLRSHEVIYEPHSFDVAFVANHQQQTLRFGYSQQEGRIAVAQASLQSAGISIETAGPQRIKSVLKLPGEVKIKHDSRAHIVPRVAGVAVDVRKTIGAQVKKGEILLVLDSRELAEMKSTFLTAHQRLQLANATFEREARLWQQKITSEQDYLSAQKEKAESEIEVRAARQSLLALGVAAETLANPEQLAQGALTRFEVRAPFAGVVLNRHVSNGEAVTADAQVYEIGNIAEMEAEISVYADQLDKVRPGQDVQLRAINGEGEAHGKILNVSSTVEQGNRAAVAHIEFTNPDSRWRDGQFVEASIVLEETDVLVAVRKEALQTFRDWTVVFAQFGEQFEVRPISVGRSDSEFIEITEGIAAGQAYAANNAFVLKAELGKAGASHDH